MSVAGSAGALGASEAASALTRVQRLQELVSSTAEAATPAGASSFAAALDAASAEGGAPPEAPEPGEGLPGPGETLEGAGEGGSVSAGGSASTGGSIGAGAVGATGSSSSPYVSSAATAANAVAAASYQTGAPSYLNTSLGGYSNAPGYASASQYGSAGPYASSLSGYAAPANAPSGATGGSEYAALIATEATRNGVEPALLQGLIEQESGFDPNAESSAGAQGLTQLMPSTAASLGVTDPFNPQQAIAGGAKLLGELLRQFGGNASDALAAYNAGAGAVQQYGGVPPYPETEAYVAKVLANAQSFRGTAG